MAKKDFPVTTAIRHLREKNISFEGFEYEYIEKGGTSQTAEELGVDEHNVIKTLVFECEKFPFLVLQHGDKEVSTKELGRLLGVKKVDPAKIENALKLTGYQFGGTSPFGTKKPLKVFIQSSIFDLDKIYINGGKRGFIISINPDDLKITLDYEKVDVAIEK